MRILSVCSRSVRLSVKRVHCDKTEERSVQISTSYERSFSLIFWEEKWLVGADPFYLKFWVNRPPLERNRRFWTDIAPSPSAVTPSEKISINTNRKFATRFPMSLKWSSYVASKPLKKGLKTQNGRFRCKIALSLKKFCYKVYLCENCQRQSCKHSLD